MRIARADEDKPVWRCGRPGKRPITPCQQGGKPIFGLLATANDQQTTNDVPHHMVKKGVCLYLDFNDVVRPSHLDVLQVAPCMGRLAVHGAERREVVFSHQRLGGPLHGLCIKGASLP